MEQTSKRGYYRGVLIRLWIVLSFAWTLFTAFMMSGSAEPYDTFTIVFALLPWLIGPVLYYAGKFVIGQ